MKGGRQTYKLLLGGKEMINKIVKFIFALFVVSTCTIFAEASEKTQEEILDYAGNINIYEEAYDIATQNTYDRIKDSYSAYAYILSNKDFFTLQQEKYIIIRVPNLEEAELNELNHFISGINEMVDLNAVEIDIETLVISEKEAPKANTYRSRATVCEILSDSRRHAQELRNIKNSSRFNGTVEAINYFYNRVKNGGAWDYKVYLGVKTKYYDPDLRRTMTGETIGNFHYGYVGRVLFSAGILKSAAGVVQIATGTSNTSWMRSYFDDPKDQRDIQSGIDAYARDNR